MCVQEKAPEAPWAYFEKGQSFKIGDIVITPFATYHDAVDPVGFKFGTERSSLGFISDTGQAPGCVAEHLSMVDSLVVESNYDPDMLAATPKRPWPLKQRIASTHGHLSNEQACDLLRRIAHDALKNVVLAHLSAESNSPELAESLMRATLHDMGLASTSLFCASQDSCLPGYGSAESASFLPPAAMFLSICEIMSTIIGALAGSIASSRVKMDLFGVIVCGTLAALGGGTVRDLLLDIPVYWTLPSGEIFVLAAVVTSLGTFYVAQKYPPPMGTIRVADAIVLALFGMIGTEISYLHGYTPTVSVMMGICTGVAGGLLRDVLTGNVPYVFRPGELYATAALLGGVAYAVLYYFGIDSSTCFVTGFVVTLSVRLAAIRWNWNLPSYIPLFSPEAEPEAMEEEEKEILSGKPGGR